MRPAAAASLIILLALEPLESSSPKALRTSALPMAEEFTLARQASM